MDPLSDPRRCDAYARSVLSSRAHSPHRESNSVDDAAASLPGDHEHDDVVWDDVREYERLHADSGASRGEDAQQEVGRSVGRERHASANTATAASDTLSAPLSPSLGASALLTAEGITQADDARLAELLLKCLGSRASAMTVRSGDGSGENGLIDEIRGADGSRVERDGDSFASEQQDGPEEGGELPPSPPQPQWRLCPSAPLPPPSPVPSDSPYRQSDGKHRREPFSMEQFMRGAIPSRGRAPRSSLQPAMSPTRVAQMTGRFRLHEERRARRLAAKRRDAETQQRLGFSYAPSINGHSRRLTRHAPAFLERQRSFLTRKQQHAQVAAARQHEAPDHAAELQARVRTPCICSRGGSIALSDRGGDSSAAAVQISPPRFDAGGLRSPVTSPARSTASGAARGSEAAAGAGHSQACQRFMAMCEKMNASFAIQRKKERMRRSVDDMLAFQRGKQRRQQELAAQLLARETQEETFAPRINPQSERICAALVESGRLDAEIARRVLRPRKGGLDKAAVVEPRSPVDTSSEVWTEVKLDMAKHAFILHGLELERMVL